MENIMKLFTSEDEKEIKSSFKNIIGEQFQTQLEQMDIYLFNPDKIEEMIEESFKEIINKITLEFEGKIREKMSKSFDKKCSKIK